MRGSDRTMTISSAIRLASCLGLALLAPAIACLEACSQHEGDDSSAASQEVVAARRIECIPTEAREACSTRTHEQPDICIKKLIIGDEGATASLVMEEQTSFGSPLGSDS